MKERPILFSAPMVRAILDGSKTQTRRIIKPQPFARPEKRDDEYLWDVFAGDEQSGTIACPFGQPGDNLWIRETWAINPNFGQDDREVVFRATSQSASGWWKPSIHMPRWASRITLEITGVRVDRLQDISEADAISEGVHAGNGEFEGCYWIGKAISGTTAKECYARLWDQINGAGSWDVNPWVWVIEFKEVRK